MEKERISVVVPIYNVEAYLQKSIESILHQTYQNLEIILVDDGATDGCPAVCDAYAATDARVRVIHKENGGLSDARNTGVAAATGDYIGFVDSDDFLKPTMYEKLLSALKETKADIAVCNFACVRADGTAIAERNQHLSIKDGVYSSREAVGYLCGEHYEYWVTAWNRLYKAELAKAVAFPKGKIHEDEFTAHLFYDKAEKIAGISEPLYQYVIREDSIMTKKYSVKNLAYAEALDGRIRYCMEHEMLPTAQAFLRWMAKYLIQVSFKLDLEDTAVKNAYTACEQMFWNSLREFDKQGKIDKKTKLAAEILRMPEFVKKLTVK